MGKGLGEESEEGDGRMNEVNEEKVVLNISENELEDIKADLCDNYCWYRKQADFDGEFEFDEFIDNYCVHCPLSRL